MTWSGRSFLTSNTSKILDFKPSQLCMGQMKHNMQVTQLVIMNALSIHINDFIGSNYVGNLEKSSDFHLWYVFCMKIICLYFICISSAHPFLGKSSV